MRISFIFLFTIASISLALFSSCSKEVNGANRLNAGHGTWLIETIELIAYDSVGNELNQITIETPGEVVFFQTHFGTAPEFLGAYNHFKGDTAAEVIQFSYYTDGKRLTVKGTFPIPLNNLYSIQKNGYKKQIWNAFTYYDNASFENRIHKRQIVTLKKQKAF